MRAVPAQLLLARLGPHFYLTPAARAVAAVDERGQIGAMVAYDEWTENSVRVHFAIDAPIAFRALVRPAFAYPFVEAGRKLLIACVAGDNEKSLRVVAKLGFRETHRIPDAVSDGMDFVLFEMRREECRWLR